MYDDVKKIYFRDDLGLQDSIYQERQPFFKKVYINLSFSAKVIYILMKSVMWTRPADANHAFLSFHAVICGGVQLDG